MGLWSNMEEMSLEGQRPSAGAGVEECKDCRPTPHINGKARRAHVSFENDVIVSGEQRNAAAAAASRGVSGGAGGGRIPANSGSGGPQANIGSNNGGRRGRILEEERHEERGCIIASSSNANADGPVAAGNDNVKSDVPRQQYVPLPHALAATAVGAVAVAGVYPPRQRCSLYGRGGARRVEVRTIDVNARVSQHPVVTPAISRTPGGGNGGGITPGGEVTGAGASRACAGPPTGLNVLQHGVVCSREPDTGVRGKVRAITRQDSGGSSRSSGRCAVSQEQSSASAAAAVSVFLEEKTQNKQGGTKEEMKQNQQRLQQEGANNAERMGAMGRVDVAVVKSPGRQQRLICPVVRARRTRDAVRQWRHLFLP